MKEKEILKQMITWYEKRISELNGKSVLYKILKEDLEKELNSYPHPQI